MLEDLLRELFDDDELAHFLGRNYPSIHDTLTNRASAAIRRSEAARALTRHTGVDLRLFRLLREERPYRRDRIAEVEQECTRRPSQSERPTKHTYSRLILAGSLLIAGALGFRQIHDWFAGETATYDDALVPAGAVSTPHDALGPAGAVSAPVPTIAATATGGLACDLDAVLVAAPATDSPFCIDKTEVSRQQFGLRCAGPREFRHDQPLSTKRDFCKDPPSMPERHPATGMSPREAITHCASLGKRLVSASEWTAAVTAELGGRDPELLLEFVNVCGKECAQHGTPGEYTHIDFYPTTAPVGVLGLPPQGRSAIHDLFGNVREIVTTDTGFRVCGGAWNSSLRGSLDPRRCIDPRNPTIPPDITSWHNDHGFRCVREPIQ